MFHVKLSFYGRGNVPRTMRGFATKEAAEGYAYEVMERYERGEIVGPAQDKRIKKVEVCDHTMRRWVTWFYSHTYTPGIPYHGLWNLPKVDNTLEIV